MPAPHTEFKPANASLEHATEKVERQERSQPHTLRAMFHKFAQKTSAAVGTPWAFVIAALVVIAWGLTGRFFHYSDTWQLVINTGTTVVTFLMVFLLQRSQNKESAAMQLKLNELVAAMQGASNRLVNVEDLAQPAVERR